MQRETWVTHCPRCGGVTPTGSTHCQIWPLCHPKPSPVIPAGLLVCCSTPGCSNTIRFVVGDPLKAHVAFEIQGVTRVPESPGFDFLRCRVCSAERVTVEQA